MADLGSITYTSVVWTAGDIITEAKLDNMVANDQAYDAHAAQGLLLNNEKAYCGKATGGTAYNLAKVNSSDQQEFGTDALTTALRGQWDGWITAGETWTYASDDDPTFTFTISGDKTTKYYAGMKIKLTQTTAKYFIITKVSYGAPNTTVTIYGGTDYNLANAAITLPFYSTDRAPAGFPLNPELWSVIVTDTSQRLQSSPTNGTWYNVGTTNSQISIPIGIWRVTYHASLYGYFSGSASQIIAYIALSDANNTASITENVRELRANVAAFTGLQIEQSMTAESVINRTSKATYYLNVQSAQASMTEVGIRGDLVQTTMKAICSYL